MQCAAVPGKDMPPPTIEKDLQSPWEGHTYCRGGICANCKMREEKEGTPGWTYLPQGRILCPPYAGGG